ncbi:MAG TPA: peptidoglycan DD-metalloendopeptidase family protein [Vicinamibacterales bacterium]|nr:peptidoglycan DD-metalloendopeptidase family protein [Vicinamibacterales bacterium]
MTSDLTPLNVQTTPATGTADPKGPNGAASAMNAAQAAKVKDLAQQFEGMLLLQMLQEMRKSISAIGGDSSSDGSEGSGFTGGLMSGTGTMNDTMDAAFAQALAQSGGFGLSADLVKSLQQQVGASSSTGLTMSGQLQTLVTAAEKAQGLTMGAPAVGLTMGTQPVLTMGTPAAAPEPAAKAAPVAAPAAIAPIPAGTPGTTGGGGNAATQAPDRPLVPDEAQALPDLSQVLDAAVNSPYGWRRDPFNGQVKFHGGVDLRAAYGAEVPVVGPGVVKFAGDEGGYGLTVLVQHADGIETRYAHLSSLDVQTGQQVTAGQMIGRVGMTGRATGPHLHFEVLDNGRRVNPEQVALQLGGKFKSSGTNAD